MCADHHVLFLSNTSNLLQILWKLVFANLFSSDGVHCRLHLGLSYLPPLLSQVALFPHNKSLSASQNRSHQKGLLATWRSRLWSRTPTFLRRWMPDSCPCGGNQYSEYYSINTDRRDICHKHRLDKMMSTRVKCHFVNVLYVHVCIIFLLVICRYMINILSELTHTKLGFYSNFMTRNAKLSY